MIFSTTIVLRFDKESGRAIATKTWRLFGVALFRTERAD